MFVVLLKRVRNAKESFRETRELLNESLLFIKLLASDVAATADILSPPLTNKRNNFVETIRHISSFIRLHSLRYCSEHLILQELS